LWRERHPPGEDSAALRGGGRLTRKDRSRRGHKERPLRAEGGTRKGRLSTAEGDPRITNYQRSRGRPGAYTPGEQSLPGSRFPRWARRGYRSPMRERFRGRRKGSGEFTQNNANQKVRILWTGGSPSCGHSGTPWTHHASHRGGDFCQTGGGRGACSRPQPR